MADGEEIELTSIRRHEAIKSLYSRHQRDRRSRIRDRASTDIPELLADQSEAPTPLLLLILQLIALYHIHILSVPPQLRWNRRQDLGSGASFEVEQAVLPLWSAKTQLAMRNTIPLATGSLGDPNFIDHTGTKWSPDTIVAFKALVSSDEERASEVIRELRVLCHEPLREHPNIVRLLGVSFVRRESVASLFNGRTASYPDNIRLGQPNSPVLVVERALPGSLYEFLKRKEARLWSIKTKLYIAADILNGLTVCKSKVP